ncbi:MAG: hypothetical protein WC450_09935 [Candidatus Omnitrophota bacterium]|jgi:hypothetical protein
MKMIVEIQADYRGTGGTDMMFLLRKYLPTDIFTVRELPQPEQANWRLLVEVIKNCQSILSDYLPPDGISEDEVIDQLLGILDDKNLIIFLRALPPQPEQKNKCQTCGHKKCLLEIDSKTPANINGCEFWIHNQAQPEQGQGEKSCENCLQFNPDKLQCYALGFCKDFSHFESIPAKQEQGQREKSCANCNLAKEHGLCLRPPDTKCNENHPYWQPIPGKVDGQYGVDFCNY